MTFERWLLKRGYKESTVRSSVRHLSTATMAFRESGATALDELAYTYPALQRFLTFVAEQPAGATRVVRPFLKAVRALGLEAAPGPQAAAPKRPEAHELPYGPIFREALQAAWGQRRGHGGDGTRESLVLLALSHCDRRVGDVLALTLGRVRKLEGAPWERLAAAMGDCKVPSAGTVAAWLLDQPEASALAGDAAYQRVNRHLRKTAEKLGIPGPNHLDRLRLSESA